MTPNKRRGGDDALKRVTTLRIEGKPFTRDSKVPEPLCHDRGFAQASAACSRAEDWCERPLVGGGTGIANPSKKRLGRGTIRPHNRAEDDYSEFTDGWTPLLLSVALKRLANFPLNLR